jgi:hypothetical protein
MILLIYSTHTGSATFHMISPAVMASACIERMLFTYRFGRRSVGTEATFESLGSKRAGRGAN